MGTITKEGSMVGVKERHRHRYEVNPEYIHLLAENGLMFVGRDETGKRMEIMELPGKINVELLTSSSIAY